MDLSQPIGLAFNRDMKVTKVIPNGQGEKAGITVGSLVLAVAGSLVRNVVDFQLEMRRCSFNGDEFCEVDFQIKERKFCKVGLVVCCLALELTYKRKSFEVCSKVSPENVFLFAVMLLATGAAEPPFRDAVFARPPR